MSIINMAKHRQHPGTLWWSGWVRCHQCGDEHVAVIPIPEWAESPPGTQCPKCTMETSCLPIAEGFFDEAPAVPWSPPEPEPFAS